METDDNFFFVVVVNIFLIFLLVLLECKIKIRLVAMRIFAGFPTFCNHFVTWSTAFLPLFPVHCHPEPFGSAVKRPLNKKAAVWGEKNSPLVREQQLILYTSNSP